MSTTRIIISFLIPLLITPVLSFALEDEANLTRSEAAFRKQAIQSVHYDVFLQLGQSDENFQGKSIIRFQLPHALHKPLRVDFYRGKISAIRLNGKTLAPTVKKPFWINLPSKDLKVGANEVEIEYSQDYARDGRGLHRFVDPETKEVFLYSNLESFDANRLMPCFDQPDLRATYSLKVEAPSHWQVISTMHESSVDATGSNRKTWTFPPSPAIATYLFALHAGPYKVWEDRAGDIPLRLFARPSMAAFVPVKDWFRWTKNGFKYFNTYFDYPYPFKKYDQVIVPEMSGAMENVAAVTFGEEYLTRSPPTRRDQRGLAETILHEMAHMWFGNLVTMKWWNDLWLNESFASFMSALALVNATEFHETWEHFHREFKDWAYHEDALKTTHPINLPVRDVRESYAIFDGITYGKGASALQQLWAYVTPENFAKGVQKFMKAHAFQNATREDLFAALQNETPRDLRKWSQMWFDFSGTDHIQAEWKCDGSRLKRLELKRLKSSQGPLRPQVLKVALYTSLDSKPEVTSTQITSEKTAILGDWPCPIFVYPNFADEGYVQVKLDPVSQQLALKSLSKIPSALLRLQIWGDYWRDVRAQNSLAENFDLPRKYLGVVVEQLPAEQNDTILKHIVASLTAGPNESQSAMNYLPLNAREEREKFQLQLEEQFLSRFRSSTGDDQKFWFDTYVAFAKSPAARAQLLSWSKSGEPAKGFKLDFDRKWDLARQLMRYQEPAAPDLVRNLNREDRSDRGRVAALESDATQPQLDVKRRWLKQLHASDKSFSIAEIESILSNLFPSEQIQLRLKLSDEFYSALRKARAPEDDDLVRAMVRYLAPLNCESPPRAKFKKLATQITQKFSPAVKREIQIRLEEDQRCQELRSR